MLNTVVSIFRTRRQDMLLGTYFSGLFSVGGLDSGVEYYTLGSTGEHLRSQSVAANPSSLVTTPGTWTAAGCASPPTSSSPRTPFKSICTKKLRVRLKIGGMRNEMKG